MKNKKPLLIAVGALVGVVILAVVIFLLVNRGAGGTRFQGPADAPYPYAWTERKDGSITMDLELGDAKGGAWTVGTLEGDVVEITEGRTGGGRTTMTLKPVRAGFANIVFALVSGEDRLAELNVMIQVSRPENVYIATVSSHRERAIQATVRGGEETDHPFTVRPSDDGLTIFVEETEGLTEDGSAWQSTTNDPMVAYVSDIQVSQEGVTIRVSMRANGTTQVTAYSSREDLSYVFNVEVRGGEMTLQDFWIEAYQTEEGPEESEAAPVETAEVESGAKP